MKQLVTLHGGTIKVESAGSGKGSAFTVRLPLAAPPEQATGPTVRPTEKEQSRSLKVLVVEDNVDVAEAMGWVLERLRHDFRLVHDGREALATARDYRPDVVILDIGLPGMDGYAVCRAFREDELFRNIPIIAQSGWGENHDKTAASRRASIITSPSP